MQDIKNVGLLGGGVIGGGWAARFLINGKNVTLYDPAPDAEAKLREVLDNALTAYHRLTLAPVSLRGELKVVSSVAEAVVGADFVQESAPEREDLKRSLLAEASRAAGPEVVIASSSSGLLPSRIQADCLNPQRVIIGHPFNPVYLLPLVETLGGVKTEDQSLARAEALYRSVGMHPLRVRHEIEGYISDRLQEALWREALHMINDGVATTDEIDEAVIYGPGLRWAFMGTCLTFHLAGGEAGMRHMLHQFGPALELPWTKLQAPELTDELIEKMVTQTEAQAGDTPIRALERLRDNCLISLMQGLRGQDYAAGHTLRQYEELLYEVSHGAAMTAESDLSQPLRLHQAQVLPEWVDYNGHMTESRYLQVFGDASDALFRFLGIDKSYHADGFSYYTVESHLRHLREIEEEAPLYTTTQLLAMDEKLMQVFHSIYDGRNDRLLATAEQMLLHVDTGAGRACPARQDILANVERIWAAQQSLPKPDGAGRAIGQATS